MNIELKNCIMDAFDPAMETFINSSRYHELNRKVDELFSELRAQLSKEQYQKLNELMNARGDVESALASEAYYRGVINGITLQKDFK